MGWGFVAICAKTLVDASLKKEKEKVCISCQNENM